MFVYINKYLYTFQNVLVLIHDEIMDFQLGPTNVRIAILMITRLTRDQKILIVIDFDIKKQQVNRSRFFFSSQF